MWGIDTLRIGLDLAARHCYRKPLHVAACAHRLPPAATACLEAQLTRR